MAKERRQTQATMKASIQRELGEGRLSTAKYWQIIIFSNRKIAFPLTP
jgi:hypothetical protein